MLVVSILIIGNVNIYVEWVLGKLGGLIEFSEGIKSI